MEQAGCLFARSGGTPDLLCYNGGMAAEQMILMIWETSVTSNDNGSAVIARKPVFSMTADKAAKVLGCDVQTVWRLYRNGVLTGCKPGAGLTVRKDGRKSNAKLRLDTESVLKYKDAIQQNGVF